MMLGDNNVPKGTFDGEFWAEENDSTCDPRSGGIFNPTSMAALGGVSERTLVNSVFPSMTNSLYHVGPVAIAGVAAIKEACRVYNIEMRNRQSEAGRRNSKGWHKGLTDASSGTNIIQS
ncbi:MAG: hypothetical protein O2967_22195 [Proteobacteria bacterium]|nr:hypothetical protein [Pseudomonadota bacterium]